MKKIITTLTISTILLLSFFGSKTYAQLEEIGNGSTATILPGKEFNVMIKTLAGQSNPTITTKNTTITQIVRSKTNDIPAGVQTGQISTTGSENLVTAWYYSGILYYYTDATNIYLSENSSSMFRELRKLTGLDLREFNTENVTDMSQMFTNDVGLVDLNLNKINTSNVRNMKSMFNTCSVLKNINLSKFDTRNVTNMESMFYKSVAVELDLTSFDTSKVTSMKSMFYQAKSLTTIYVSDKFSLDKVTSSGTMFTDDTKLVGGNGTKYTSSIVDGTYAVIDNDEHPGYFSVLNKESIFLPGKEFNNKIKFMANGENNSIDNNIKSVIRSKELPEREDLEILSVIGAKNPIYARYDNGNLHYYTKSNQVYLNQNSASMFSNLASLENLDLSNFNTTEVTNMESMFNGCRSLKTLNLGNFDTSNVTTMEKTFQNCELLEVLNLEDFDTSKVKKMYSMFGYDTNLKTIYVSDKFVTTALSGASSSNNMFTGDINIIGGNGTTFDSTHVDGEYAVIDNDNHPGYFTDALNVEYNITYNLDGGILSGEKNKYTKNDSFIIPAPTKEGYIFTGWTGSNGETPELEVLVLEGTKGNLEYTANREKIEEENNEIEENNKYSGGGMGGKQTQNDENINTENDSDDNSKEETSEKIDDNIKDFTIDIENYNADYSYEQNEAFQFAYKNGISSKSSIDEANLKGFLKRIDMAKLLSNYAINILGKTPDNSKNISFPDVSKKLNLEYGNAVTLSYQLGIMGINVNKFRPNDTVTRAEFATALSRMLFGLADGKKLYYETHLQKLLEEKIITVPNPKLKELRGYAMIMLKRSVK